MIDLFPVLLGCALIGVMVASYVVINACRLSSMTSRDEGWDD
jgi:hypothetical protein